MSKILVEIDEEAMSRASEVLAGLPDESSDVLATDLLDRISRLRPDNKALILAQPDEKIDAVFTIGLNSRNPRGWNTSRGAAQAQMLLSTDDSADVTLQLFDAHAEGLMPETSIVSKGSEKLSLDYALTHLADFLYVSPFLARKDSLHPQVRGDDPLTSEHIDRWTGGERLLVIDGRPSAERRTVSDHELFQVMSELAAKSGSELEVVFANCAIPSIWLDRPTTIHGRLRLVDVTISGGTSLSGITFARTPTFKNVHFQGLTEFRNAVFEEGLDLSGSSFAEDATFLDASIAGSVNLSNASFAASAVFQRVEVAGGFLARGASFGGRANFGTMRFGDDVFFVDASFSDKLDFSNSDFDGQVDLRNTTYEDQASIDLTAASVSGQFVITPTGAVELASVRSSRFGTELFLGDGVTANRCDFRECPDLGKIALVSNNLFAAKASENLIHPSDASHSEMASVYRQLRKNAETSGDRDLAANLYGAEMGARRKAAWTSPKNISSGILLEAYRWISGFGLRPLLPVAWVLALSVIGAFLLLVNGVDLVVGCSTNGNPCEDAGASFLEAWTFAVKSMLSFIRPPDGDLSTGEEWVQIGLRFSGPLLLAQIALAVRDRLART